MSKNLCKLCGEHTWNVPPVIKKQFRNWCNRKRNADEKKQYMEYRMSLPDRQPGTICAKCSLKEIEKSKIWAREQKIIAMGGKALSEEEEEEEAPEETETEQAKKELKTLKRAKWRDARKRDFGKASTFNKWEKLIKRVPSGQVFDLRHEEGNENWLRYNYGPAFFGDMTHLDWLMYIDAVDRLYKTHKAQLPAEVKNRIKLRAERSAGKSHSVVFGQH